MGSSTKKRIALFVVILLFTVFLFAVPSAFLYQFSLSKVTEDHKQYANAIASSVGYLIEENLDSFSALSNAMDDQTGSYDTSYYERIQLRLHAMNNQMNTACIEVVKYIDDQTMMMLIDSEDTVSEDYIELGERLTIYPILQSIYAGEVDESTNAMYNDEKGTYVVGYSVIYDQTQEHILGVVIVHNSIDSIQDYLSTVALGIGVTISVLIIFTTLLMFKLLDLRMEVLNKDYLTSLYSKRYLETKLRRAMKESRFKNTPLSLVMIDVDYFKEINDNYGHYVGDIVLKEVANVLLYSTRNIDICSRYGGDEFMIIFPNTLSENTIQIIENIIKAILKIKVANEKIQISVSIGIAQWDRVADIENFVTQADKAMYVSKNTGKNKYTLYK